LLTNEEDKGRTLIILIRGLATWQIAYLEFFLPPFNTLNYAVKYHVSYKTYRLVYNYRTAKSLLVGKVTCNNPIWKHREMSVEHFASLYLKKLQAGHTAVTQNHCFSFATHG
jgi:hypothetical protein